MRASGFAPPEKMLGRSLDIPGDAILRHYHNRGFLPFEIAQNLSESELGELKGNLPAGLSLKPVYVRVYPNKSVAGQVIGYTGRTSRNADGIIENGQVLWPETEGREGLEQTFNSMLTGRHGKYKVTFDRDGRKTSERIVEPPVPGYNIVTTLDLRLQELAEKALAAKAKRGAIVIMDPNNGDILALASWPTFDPNEFIPSISTAKFKALQSDPNIPLLPRAYRSAYPPGSTFKVAVGLAALESNTITPQDEYECVPAMDVGNTTFHNWKHSDRGSLNFVQALTESCDTWFYQVGIATGAGPILGMGGQARLRRENRDPAERRSGGPFAQRPIHEGNPRPQDSQWRHRQHVDRPGRPARHADANGAGDGDRGKWRNILSDAARRSRCRRSGTKSWRRIQCGRKRPSTLRPT